MAGPPGAKQTGTRPKSSSSSSQPSLAPVYGHQVGGRQILHLLPHLSHLPLQGAREEGPGLAWEQQAVTDNLALLRTHLDLLDRSAATCCPQHLLT